MIGPNADNVEVAARQLQRRALGAGHAARRHPPQTRLRARRCSTRRAANCAEGLPGWRPCPPRRSSPRDGADRQHRPQGRILQYGLASTGRCTAPRARRLLAAAANATPLFTRVDPEVNFRWWDGAPRADMDDDNFGVRWSGFLAPKVTGKYQLGGVGMNAFEIYFNGKQIARGNNIHERNYELRDRRSGSGQALPDPAWTSTRVINDADMRLVWSVPDAIWNRRRWMRRAQGGCRGDVPGPFAASGRRGDEGAGGGIPGRRPRRPRHCPPPRRRCCKRWSRSANRSCWCCSTAARWR